MINALTIRNFKSVLDATFPLTRLTVLIGENGAGKSNILESLVLAAAASEDKLDTEYLIARGVRLTEPHLMKSTFNALTKNKPINIEIQSKASFPGTSSETRCFKFLLRFNSESQVNRWTLDPKSEFPFFGIQKNLNGILLKSKIRPLDESDLAQLRLISSELRKTINEADKTLKVENNPALLQPVNQPVAHVLDVMTEKFAFDRFTVYSPSYDALRNHQTPPPTSPLGPRGEGLLAELSTLQTKEPERFKDVLASLELFGWYKAIRLPKNEKTNSALELHSIGVLDRYIRSRGIELSEMSVNEGFFFVLFYMTLVCSNSTPRFFAIENIETALNPRLCETVVSRIYELAKKYDKQIILTTHSPAALDALNIDDPDQSLVIVRRNNDGHTHGSEFKKPSQRKGNRPVRLSEAFLKGHIGGLPKGI